jgi:hypothetical protein
MVVAPEPMPREHSLAIAKIDTGIDTGAGGDGNAGATALSSHGEGSVSESTQSSKGFGKDGDEKKDGEIRTAETAALTTTTSSAAALNVTYTDVTSARFAANPSSMSRRLSRLLSAMPYGNTNSNSNSNSNSIGGGFSGANRARVGVILPSNDEAVKAEGGGGGGAGAFRSALGYGSSQMR